MTPENEIIKIIKDNSYVGQFPNGKNVYEIGELDLELIAHEIVKSLKL